MSIGYSIDALVYDSGSDTWSLRADYDHSQHRVDIAISDGDAYLDGDYYNGETGDDSNQTATVTDMGGIQVATGQVYSEEYYELTGPGGEIIRIDLIEIDGVAVGYLVSSPLTEGVTYDETGFGNVYVDEEWEEGEEGEEDVNTRTSYSEISGVPCFCQGTHLATDQGDVPVDWLGPGDRVLTKDHGYQAILWVGRSKISRANLKKYPSLRPIRIAANSISAGVPAQDLRLSPEHRMLLGSAHLELLFGVAEAFAPVKSIVDGQQITQTDPQHEVSYYHVLFERHEIVLAEGLWSESFFPEKVTLGALSDGDRKKVLAVLGPRAESMKTARLCLRPWEAGLLQPQLNTPELLQRQAA